MENFSESNYSSTDMDLVDIYSNVKAGKSRGNKRRGPRRREQHMIVMDLFLALILCHNVTPVYTDPPAEED